MEVEVISPNLDSETVRAEIDRVRGSVQQRATWANDDLAKFLVRAESALREAYASRKARILNDRQVEDALGIPVQTSAQARPPVPAQRSLISLETRVAQAGFVPEPMLEDAIYEDVLQVVRAWATSLERSPGTAAKLDEEELRDLLLGTLNGYWRGAAGGELFNGSGKTDILIRHNDRNAFIGECKVWRGPKTVESALDQLFSYLVWRDSKAALVVFISTKDPAATIDALHDAVAAHPAHILTKNAVNRASRGDYIMTADAEGRRISLAVIPVVIRASASSAT